MQQTAFADGEGRGSVPWTKDHGEASVIALYSHASAALCVALYCPGHRSGQAEWVQICIAKRLIKTLYRSLRAKCDLTFAARRLNGIVVTCLHSTQHIRMFVLASQSMEFRSELYSKRHPGTLGSQRHRPSEDTLISRGGSETTLVDGSNMASANDSAATERKRSFGIGGAGNIRNYLR